jgi:hypothetical protein
MRKIPIILFLLITSCMSRKEIQLSDGTLVSEREYKKRIDSAFKKGLSEVTQEDIKILDSTNVTVDFILVDSIPVDTTKKNRFLVLDLRTNLTFEESLPPGSDFWEYNKKDTVEILDTLEFHTIK